MSSKWSISPIEPKNKIITKKTKKKRKEKNSINPRDNETDSSAPRSEGTKRVETQTNETLFGLKAMKQKYNDSIVDPIQLQKEINQFMSDYDKRIEEEKLKAKESDGIPDDEGWIKVNRFSKRKSLPNDYSNDEKIVEKHNKKRKKSSNDLNNFYSFKVKESKIEYLMNLRNKFEEDKKKIAIMKAQRKFRPI